MKTFDYIINYKEFEAKTVATIDFSKTIRAIDNKYPGMLKAYSDLTMKLLSLIVKLLPLQILLPEMSQSQRLDSFLRQ